MAGITFGEGTASAQGGAGIFAQFEEHDTTPNSNLRFYTQGGSFSERLRIDFSGNVGIGTTTPGYKLDVQGGDINASGSVRAAGVALTSDIRFKKDVRQLDQALARLLRLRGVSYSWRQDEFPERNFSARPQVGVIAQEVEKQFPELVDTDSKGFKSVSYPALVSPIIEALRELYQGLLGTQDDVAALKAENSRLKAADEAKTRDLEAKGREIAKSKKEIAELRTAVCEINPKAKICKESRN